VQGVAIGCAWPPQPRGLFVGASGLLGLGWGPMSLVGQLGGAFSYSLSTRDRGSNATGAGSLVLGRTDAVPEGAVWVTLVRNPQAPSLYYVGLAGIGVGDERLPLQAGLFQPTEDGVVMGTCRGRRTPRCATRSQAPWASSRARWQCRCSTRPTT
jgi:hypothetical protein